MALSAGGEEHENVARKQRVRRKRAVDSAHRAARAAVPVRRSSRIASNASAKHVDAVTKASLRASRFDFAGGSSELVSAASAAGFDSGIPSFLSLQLLQGLGAPCGVSADALAAEDAVRPATP